jgi:hypothetical protein
MGRSSFIAAAAAAWLVYLAMDFLVNGVALAPWWRTTGSSWLSPQTLLERIPLAYLSFAIYAVVLTWLLAYLVRPRPAVLTGLGFGALAGCISGIWSVLAVYSVFSVPQTLLLVWPVTAILESAVAGAAAAFLLKSSTPWRRLIFILLITLVLFILGVILQNLFFPTAANRIQSLSIFTVRLFL